MSPEHPDWKPWWVRYVQFDGVELYIDDFGGTGEYGVVQMPLDLREFRWRGAVPYIGNSLDEANAAFDAAEAALRGVPVG